MSSSDKFPDWSVFKKRAVPFEVELLSPASEVAALLQRYSTDLDKAHKEIAGVRREGLKTAAQQAVFVVQLSQALDLYESVLAQASLERVHRHIRIVKDQMLNALKEAGLEINVPLGKPFSEVADSVNVDGWRRSEDYASEVVAEVVEPIVTYKGILIRTGRVVMGAPPEKNGNQEKPSEIKNKQGENEKHDKTDS